MATDLTCKYLTKTIDYGKMLEIQEKERADVLSGKTKGTVFFLEHQSVYTSGLRGNSSHFLDDTGIPIFKVKRGGEVTWHGPGQLVIYPVIHMKASGFRSVREFVGYFGNIITSVVQDGCGIKTAKWIDEKAGIWVGDKKIAFSGLHFRKFVPIHGYSLNISCDLEPFSKIIPCGIEGLKVTSVELENAEEVKAFDIIEKIVKRMNNRFPNLKMIEEAL